MTHSPLQSLETAAYMPSKVRLHTQPNGNISFRNAIAIRGNGREAHANDAIVLGNLGDYVDPQRVCAVIEDHYHVFAVPDFADGSHLSAFMAAREETK